MDFHKAQKKKEVVTKLSRAASFVFCLILLWHYTLDVQRAVSRYARKTDLQDSAVGAFQFEDELESDKVATEYPLSIGRHAAVVD